MIWKCQSFKRTAQLGITCLTACGDLVLHSLAFPGFCIPPHMLQGCTPAITGLKYCPHITLRCLDVLFASSFCLCTYSKFSSPCQGVVCHYFILLLSWCPLFSHSFIHKIHQPLPNILTSHTPAVSWDFISLHLETVNGPDREVGVIVFMGI